MGEASVQLEIVSTGTLMGQELEADGEKCATRDSKAWAIWNFI